MDQELLQIALDSGATYSAFLKVADVPFSQEVRKMCEMNTCGMYGKSHSCPPAIGDVETLHEKLSQYDYGVVVQTVYQLEDCFDYDGMMEAARIHKKNFLEALERIRLRYPEQKPYPLNAGSCSYCESCTYPDGQPCRYPEQAIVSLEACGIFVNKMLEKTGLKYNNGKDTVSYVGVVFLKDL